MIGLRFIRMISFCVELARAHEASALWLARAEASLANKSGPVNEVRVMRVNQLDAQMLDGELARLLLSQVHIIFKFLNPRWLMDYQSEVLFLITAAIIVIEFKISS